MDCTADPGMKTLVHKHPEADETYQVLSGTPEVLFQGEWRSLRAGQSFDVPRGEVHAWRTAGNEAVRFTNRHTPALGFHDHLETVHRLIRAGKVRGSNDPRSTPRAKSVPLQECPVKLTKPNPASAALQISSQIRVMNTAGMPSTSPYHVRDMISQIQWWLRHRYR